MIKKVHALVAYAPNSLSIVACGNKGNVLYVPNGGVVTCKTCLKSIAIFKRLYK